MSGKAFVDSNILVYAHDRREIRKSQSARALLDQLWLEKRGVLSTQVLQEFCVNARRKFVKPMELKEVHGVMQVYQQWQVVINTPESILRALAVEEQYQLSFWDAMIVQAAESANCEILYSEDFAHGREYEGVRVVNPFVETRGSL